MTQRRFTEQEERRIAERYRTGESAPVLAKAFSVSTATVQNILRRQGGNSRPAGGPRKYGDDIRLQAAELYESGLNLREIGETLGLVCGESYTRKLLLNAGVSLRPLYDTQRRLALKDRYFAEIDTEERAYWLGFLAADGNIQTGNNSAGDGRISLQLHRKDRQHIEVFKQALGSDAQIKDREGCKNGVRYQASYIQIHSGRMAHDLCRHGIVPRKSLILEPWHGPSDLMRHYWRGLVDGDGSVLEKCIHRGKRPIGTRKWTLCLCGTLAIVSAFAEFMQANVDEKWRVRPNRSIFVATNNTLAGAHAGVHLLYGDCSVSLSRKLVTAKSVMSQSLVHGNTGQR